MFNKKNIIKHYIDLPHALQLEPAKKFIPNWYKETPRIDSSSKDAKRLPVLKSFKACSPFLESLQSGYMIPLHTDIAIEQTEGGPSISFNPDDEPPVKLRDSSINLKLPTPNGFSSLHFIWDTKVSIKIPDGYSLLFTHPLNRFDLPFITLTGIIDGEYFMCGGNVPVFFSKDFEGIIPAGTPIAQVIPFKTENWTNELDKTVLEKSTISKRRSLSEQSWYKKNFWKKKEYN